MTRPSFEYAEKKREKKGHLASYSLYFVVAALLLDGLAMLQGDVIYLLISGLLMVVAWSMAMQSFNKVNKLLEAQNLKKR